MPHPLSPPSLPSRIIEHVIPKHAVTPVPSTIVEPEPEPETCTGVEAERLATAAPQKVKLSLQAWKVKKQPEKREQQQAGNAQAQAEGCGVEVGNVNGGGSTQASPMSVISALGVGEEEQQQGGAMEVESSPVESCKPDVVEMVRPSTATTTTMATITTTTTTSAAPVIKLELNGYHGPPLLSSFDETHSFNTDPALSFNAADLVFCGYWLLPKCARMRAIHHTRRIC